MYLASKSLSVSLFKKKKEETPLNLQNNIIGVNAN
jgi:hypothetical protein